MLGPDGPPLLLTKIALAEITKTPLPFLRWLTPQEWEEAVALLEVRHALAERDRKDAERKAQQEQG